MTFEDTLRAIVREELRAALRELAPAMPATLPEGGKLYLSPEEAAELVGVHVDTVREWLRSGELPTHGKGSRVVRVRRDQLERFLERGGAERATAEVDLDEEARQIVAGRIGKVRAAR